MLLVYLGLLASITCQCVLVYALLTLFIEFVLDFYTNLHLIKFVTILCMVCVLFFIVDVSKEENSCKEVF